MPWKDPEKKKAFDNHKEGWKKRCLKRGILIKSHTIFLPATKPTDLHQRVKAISEKYGIPIQRLLIKAIEGYVSYVEKRDKEQAEKP